MYPTPSELESEIYKIEIDNAFNIMCKNKIIIF